MTNSKRQPSSGSKSEDPINPMILNHQVLSFGLVSTKEIRENSGLNTRNTEDPGGVRHYQIIHFLYVLAQSENSVYTDSHHFHNITLVNIHFSMV